MASSTQNERCVALFPNPAHTNTVELFLTFVLCRCRSRPSVNKSKCQYFEQNSNPGNSFPSCTTDCSNQSATRSCAMESAPFSSCRCSASYSPKLGSIMGKKSCNRFLTTSLFWHLPSSQVSSLKTGPQVLFFFNTLGFCIFAPARRSVSKYKLRAPTLFTIRGSMSVFSELSIFPGSSKNLR
jgi:hypothetical protein